MFTTYHKNRQDHHIMALTGEEQQLYQNAQLGLWSTNHNPAINNFNNRSRPTLEQLKSSLTVETDLTVCLYDRRRQHETVKCGVTLMQNYRGRLHVITTMIQDE